MADESFAEMAFELRLLARHRREAAQSLDSLTSLLDSAACRRTAADFARSAAVIDSAARLMEQLAPHEDIVRTILRIRPKVRA
jgi:hypothetical protein